MNAPVTSPQPMPRRLATFALAGAGLLVLLGIGTVWWAARTMTQEPTDGEVLVTITDTSCQPASLSVPAGKSTFRIHNASDRVLEWEILDGVMVLAERENIAPGLNATVSPRLKPGTYDITCGLLSNPRGTLTVVETAASAAATTAPELRAFIGPLSEYRVYLSRRSSELVKATAALSDRIAAGDVEGAKAAWLAARKPWRQMAPVVGRMGDLTNTMDPLAAYLQGREKDPAFSGFHRIEYGLWTQNSTDGLAPIVSELATNAVALQTRIKELQVAPADLAGNAAELAARVADQASGGQVPYSQVDLTEFSADLDGIAKSALLIDPLVAEAVPARSKDLQQALDATQATLQGFAIDGVFPSYDKIDDAARQKIAASFTALSQAIGAMNGEIGLE